MRARADCLAEHVDEAGPLRRALHRLYRDLKEALLEDPPPEERVRIAGWAKRRLRRWLGKEYRNVEVVRFVGKVRNGFDHWFTFVTTPGVEPTNNRAERAQVRGAVAQLNHLAFSIRAFIRLEVNRLKAGVSWYEAKLSIIRDAIRTYLTNLTFTLTPTA